MAKVQKKSPARAGRNGARPEEKLPEGFDALEFGRVAGWFKVEAGNEIQGRIVDSFETSGQFGPRKVYKIEATADGTTIIDSDGQEVEAQAGDVVGVDEKGFLKRLADVPFGAEVFVRCIGKEAPSADFKQGVWRFALGVAKGTKIERKVRGNQQDRRGREPGQDDGPLPF